MYHASNLPPVDDQEVTKAIDPESDDKRECEDSDTVDQ